MSEEEESIFWRPEPTAWITHESLWRLKDGGNSRGSVPVHRKKSNTSVVALYTDQQVNEIAAAAFCKGTMLPRTQE